MSSSLMGDMDGLLVDDIGYEGSIQWVTARCGDTYGPGYHYAVTSAVEGVAGYSKRPPIQHHLTTTGTLLARMSDAIRSLADHASGNSNSSSLATSRSGATWRGRGFPGHRLRHVLVLNVTGHAHSDSFKRGFESNLVMSDTDHVPFTDLVRHVGARLADARESLLSSSPQSSPQSSPSLSSSSPSTPENIENIVEVILNISSCFVPSACIETAMELKRLSASFPGVHIILPCDMVTQPDAIGFNMGFHAKLLDGASVRDAALYAGQHNHFSVRGIVLFSGGERFDVRPLFPLGSAKADRSVLPFLPGKHKRPRDEGRREEEWREEGRKEGRKEGRREEGHDVEKNVKKKHLSASTPTAATATATATTTLTLAEAVLPNTPNMPILTSLQLADLDDLKAMGFYLVTNAGAGSAPLGEASVAEVVAPTTAEVVAPPADASASAGDDDDDGPEMGRPRAPGDAEKRRANALSTLIKRHGYGVVIYALGPVPRGSIYASDASESEGSWLFSKPERQQVSSVDGLSARERKRLKLANGRPKNLLGRVNGSIFSMHGLISADGLARIYPRIKAYLGKTPFS